MTLADSLPDPPATTLRGPVVIRGTVAMRHLWDRAERDRANGRRGDRHAGGARSYWLWEDWWVDFYERVWFGSSDLVTAIDSCADARIACVQRAN
jgi:hypothetical protein